MESFISAVITIYAVHYDVIVQVYVAPNCIIETKCLMKNGMSLNKNKDNKS